MGIKKQIKKAKKATKDVAKDAVDAAGDVLDDGVDWAEGVGKSVMKQTVKLSAEAERMAGDAVKGLEKFGGDMAKALEDAIWKDLLQKLARQVVKDNDGLIREALKTARTIEKKTSELTNLAKQSTKVFTREIPADSDGAAEIAADLNF